MGHEQELRRWWQTRWFVVLAVLASTLPLLWPALPPLTDVPGHIGRYRILAEAGTGPLAMHYAVRWALIGNLGVDAIVVALSPLVDVEIAAKWVVVAIPALTTAAMLWLAREAHGRITPTAAFALPLAYSMPFQLGFVNFTLAAALAIAGLAGWIRLARTSPDWVRIVVFVPVAGLIWFCHSFGWAMFGLFVLGAEYVIRRDRGMTRVRALGIALLAVVPMAWPQAVGMVAGPPPQGDTGDWFLWPAKIQWIVSLLRERWLPYDTVCLVGLIWLIWATVRDKRLSFTPLLGVPALLGLLAFVLLPRLFAGGAYVDMRILPYTVALALLAIRIAPGHGVLAKRLALIGAVFFAVRITTGIVAFALFAREQQGELNAVAAIPVGAGVLTLIDEPEASWQYSRLRHIAGIAVAKRRVFTNEQWAIAGQQLIEPRHPRAAPFDRDPSQLAGLRGDPDAYTDFDTAIARFDRTTFSHIWTIGFPVGRARADDLRLVWSNGGSALYRVVAPNARLSVAQRPR